ncbi:TPA: LPXTG cell wall anchor domain-containing protein [Streptococcus suis]
MSEEDSGSHSESVSSEAIAGKQLQRSGVLPNTGEESASWPALLGAGLLLGAFFKRRKKDENEQAD